MVLKVETIQKIARLFNYEISGHKGLICIYRRFPKEMGTEFKAIFSKCNKYTMTSIERMFALYQAVNYVVKSKIKGDFVECGVWGGAAAC